MQNHLDFQSDLPVALTDVPDLLPRRHGKKVHHSTVYRWVTKGARGRMLASWMIGGIRYTSVEALKRFLQSEADRTNDDKRATVKQALYGGVNK